MEVRKGYKQTEVGVIPEQWEEIILDEICNIKRGASPRPIERFVTDTYEGVNWIRIGDVDKSGVIKETQQKITKEGKEKSVFVNKGDLLLSNSMSFGKPYLLEIDGCIHDGWLAISEKKNAISKKYLYYYLMSTKARSFFEIMSAGSGVQNLKKETVSKLKVAVPNDSEQQAISIALSDIDGLISSLTKIINKKKNIKQGAMQELLTGKKRLEGFGGEWESKDLGDVGYLLIERINPQLYKDRLFEVYSMPAYDTGKKPEFIKGIEMNSNKFCIMHNVLLFNKLNIHQKRVWHIEECEENSICSSEFLPYYSEHIDLRFLLQVLLSDKCTSDFLGISSGTSNSQKRITPQSFLDYILFLPEKNEQTAIANILSDMDDEIEKLEQKLDKYKAIKQGMMQELLTGRIRLVGEGTQ